MQKDLPRNKRQNIIYDSTGKDQVKTLKINKIEQVYSYPLIELIKYSSFCKYFPVSEDPEMVLEPLRQASEELQLLEVR